MNKQVKKPVMKEQTNGQMVSPCCFASPEDKSMCPGCAGLSHGSWNTLLTQASPLMTYLLCLEMNYPSLNATQ